MFAKGWFFEASPGAVDLLTSEGFAVTPQGPFSVFIKENDKHEK